MSKVEKSGSEPLITNFKLMLHLNSEIRWSAFLASLILNDTSTAASWLGLEPADICTVQCERVDQDGRPDIVLVDEHDRISAVIEVKILAGLGPSQLERYLQPQNGRTISYRLIVPGQFPLSIRAESWQLNTWEDVLGQFTTSSNRWVALTSAGMISHLSDELPSINEQMSWVDLPIGSDFRLEVRGRVSWLYRQLIPRASGNLALETSSSSNVSIISYEIPFEHPSGDYSVYMEIEESLSRKKGWPLVVAEDSTRPTGPIAIIGLKKNDSTSRGFDWDLLHAMWTNALKDTGMDFLAASAKPRAEHDKEIWGTQVKTGMPKFVGRGYGENQAAKHGFCVFGVHAMLSGDSMDSLAESAQSLIAQLHNMEEVAVARTTNK